MLSYDSGSQIFFDHAPIWGVGAKLVVIVSPADIIIIILISVILILTFGDRKPTLEQRTHVQSS